MDSSNPGISLFEPVAGDAGSRVLSSSLDGKPREWMEYEYISTDNGKGWEPIAPVVDIHDEEWGNYPVVVPDIPSERCLIQIEGFFSESSAISGLFSIIYGS